MTPGPDLNGKVVLITGATSGIGRATAVAFGKRGARVVASGRDAARGESVVEEIEEAGGEALFIAGDLARPDAAEQLVAKAVARFGRLDCAFNNAAEVGETKELADYTDEEFDAMVANDLQSVWRCMKQEIRAMLAQVPAGGAIVNTATVNALGGVPQGSLYAMAKAGVLALTKSAALEYAQRNIRINAIVPGAIRTPMMDSVIDRHAGGVAENRPAVEQALNAWVPLGRLGTAEEVAEAVVWLCSGAASYVVGQTFIIDGGLTSPYR